MFKTFEIFCQVMDQCTENYECIVIYNNAKSNKLEDQVFWYKADTHPNFKVGAPEFWEHHTENYLDDTTADEKMYDPSSHSKKGPRINVKKY